MATETRIGSEIGAYQVLSVLGRGGMSTVYLAMHKTLERPCALKLLPPELATLPGYRERFVRESQNVAALRHPNIIEIYDAGEVDGLLYIAMRHVDGADLSVELEHGPLPLGRTLYILEQVANALDAAHARGLVHRDVKPANIIIERDTDHVFLTDFGIAKATAGAGFTVAGTFRGTIDYAAPEQIEGRPVDARTDVYALGCVLYVCLTGVPPYTENPERSVLQAKLVEPPPRPTRVRAELPPQLDVVVARAIATDMDERFGSCGELIAAARAACIAAPSRPPGLHESGFAAGDSTVMSQTIEPATDADPTAGGPPDRGW